MRSKFYLTLSFFFLGLTLLSLFWFINFNQKPELLNLSDYPYPNPNQKQPEYETIAILATNDIHGHILPSQYTTLDTAEPYNVGGLLLMSSYIQTLKREWNDKLLWLDAGDQFQGTIESNSVNGESIVKSINFQNMSDSIAAAIGNHEFDFGLANLTRIINEANFPYLDSNIINKTTGKPQNFTNSRENKIFKVGSLKVGVFGMTTQETPFTTATNVSNLLFDDYLNTTLKESKALRDAGADLVLLTCHIGMFCLQGDLNDLYDIGLRNASTIPKTNCSPTDELYKFLEKVPEGVIDGVVGGHVHTLAHHWRNKIPVVMGASYAKYFNVLYFKYDKLNKKLLLNETQIEGPVPVCDKIFSKIKRCELEAGVVSRDGQLSEFLFHNQHIKFDHSLYKYIKPYLKQAEEYQKDIYGYVQNPMNVTSDEESPLGDFIADCLQNASRSDVSLVNMGMLRINWPRGNLSYYTLFETIPFQNQISSFEMTGEELLKAIAILQSANLAFYSTAGLRQYVGINPSKHLINVTLFNGTVIENEKTYLVSAPDFLMKGGDDFRLVRQFYTPRNVKNHGFIKEALRSYVRSIGTLNTDSDPVVKKSQPRLVVVNNYANKFLN
jgi:5'-nucleotidase